MKTTMTLGGIGPKLALMSLPYVILSMSIMYRDPQFLDIQFLDTKYVRFLGWGWLAAGLVLWIASAITFLKGFKTGKLRRNFGNEYEQYENSVNELLPLPRFSVFKNDNGN